MSGHSSVHDAGRTPRPAMPEQLPVEPPEEQELIAYLEPDQLVAETFRPVTRAILTRNAAVVLWALRVFVVLVSLMVIYTFVVRLH
jgi:hypothetical protein